MGSGASTPLNILQKTPQNAPPMPVAAMPTQRNPVRDGASGLHYSGNVYANQHQQLSSNICDGSTVNPNQINDVMDGSISTTSPLASRDAVKVYVKSLGNKIPGPSDDFDKQAVADANLYQSMQTEYCFYEKRYVAALKQFVTLVAAQSATDPNAVATALADTVKLNKRLNSLIEIMNYVGNERARQVNNRSPKINETNEKLKAQLETLKKQQNFLESSDVRIRTQEEMMRFSAEKSRAMNIQIMFFVALNVVALGTILTVYKGSAPK